ncbi:N-acetyltransferase GCN5 [Bifidobacterium thermophilum RBL67]|uniref:N-acetyltransferase GCN5 n=2 Tax=Bifidobacterium thermophilum TaxID=33905 RepID=M4RRR8_9BIFI|nr:N-acetyltransferase [Bifidobacterium thermophilum]AGH41212.1 N-acetyltransferase GCN5 [Bifidobacterium thermophilum RBL67]
MAPRRDTIGRMSTPTPSFTLLPIRTATVQDLDAIDRLEQACFPPAEAASRASISSRLSVFPDHFWLLEAQHGPDGGTRLVSFVNGMVTDQPHLLDEMYDDAGMHNPQGAWQMIFGVDTHPDYRRHGYAGRVLRHAIETAREQGRRGVVLTCKDRLVQFYAALGFQDEGMSTSTHGGVPWHEMRLTF